MTGVVLIATAVVIGVGGGYAMVQAVRAPSPRRGTIGLASAAMVVLALAVVLILARMPPP
jgi:hypothetical protein